MIPTTSTSITTAPTIDHGSSGTNAADSSAGDGAFAEALAGAHTVLDASNTSPKPTHSNDNSSDSDGVGHEAQDTSNEEAPIADDSELESEAPADTSDSQGAAQEQTAAAATNQKANEANSEAHGKAAQSQASETAKLTPAGQVLLADDAIVTADAPETATGTAPTSATPAPSVAPSTGSLLAQAQVAQLTEAPADTAAVQEGTTNPVPTTTQAAANTEVSASDVATGQKSQEPGNDAATTGPNSQSLAGRTEVVETTETDSEVPTTEAQKTHKAASDEAAEVESNKAQAHAAKAAENSAAAAKAQSADDAEGTAQVQKPEHGNAKGESVQHANSSGNNNGAAADDTSSDAEGEAGEHTNNSQRFNTTPGSATGQAHRSAAAQEALARAHGGGEATEGEANAPSSAAPTLPTQASATAQANAAAAAAGDSAATATATTTQASGDAAQNAAAPTVETEAGQPTGANAASGPSAGLDKAAARQSVLPQMNEERLEHIADQLSARLKLSQAAGGTQVHLSLRPRELGDVNVQLTLRNGTVHANVVVDRPQTGVLLQSNVEELRRTLQEKGLSVDHFSVDVKDGQSQGALDRGAHNAFGQAASNNSNSGSGAQALAGSAAADSEWEADNNIVTADDAHNGIVSVLA